jgi:hypothetical protein
VKVNSYKEVENGFELIKSYPSMPEIFGVIHGKRGANQS